MTIPEAAAKIGVSERTLYRLLKSDNFAARTVTQHRQTVTGRRLTTLLPPDMVEEIARMQPPPSVQSLSQEKAEGAKGSGTGENVADAGEDTDNDAASGDRNTGKDADNASGTVTDGDADTVLPEDTVSAVTLPAIVYQARIMDLEAMNAELRADKERLYRLLEMAQANLAREQALRSLPAPDVEASATKASDVGQNSAPQMPPVPPDDTETGALVQDGAEVKRTTAAPAESKLAESKPVSFWARLMGRKE